MYWGNFPAQSPVLPSAHYLHTVLKRSPGAFLCAGFQSFLSLWAVSLRKGILAFKIFLSKGIFLFQISCAEPTWKNVHDKCQFLLHYPTAPRFPRPPPEQDKGQSPGWDAPSPRIQTLSSIWAVLLFLPYIVCCCRLFLAPFLLAPDPL